MANKNLKKYKRNINELRDVAAIWWPEELREDQKKERKEEKLGTRRKEKER